MTEKVARPAGYRRLRIFAAGLGVRLFGAALIWAGDGHDSVFRKGMVVAGVVLSVGGIGVLKYLLYSGLGRKRPALSSAKA